MLFNNYIRWMQLLLGIVASVCVFALLFLIPLVVEPSISTLLADFDPEAATCVTIDYTYATGLSKCGRWSSCREGCTSTPSQCHQIYVSYRKAASKSGFPRLENFTMVDPSDWLVSIVLSQRKFIYFHNGGCSHYLITFSHHRFTG